MVSSSAVTHLMLIAPLAWALRAAGHDVLVVGPPDIAAVARSAGLSAVVIGEEHNEVERWRRRPAPVPGGEPPWEFFRAEWADRADRMIPRYLVLARSWRPDLLITDPLEFVALSVGAVLNVPVVQHRWGLDLIGAARLEHMRDALGDLAVPALVLDPCPPAVQSPDVVPGMPIRAVPSNGVGVLPDWVPRRRYERRVCLSMGNRTVRMGGLPMLRHAIEAAAGLPGTETVVTVDRATQAEIGSVPACVRLVDPLPLDLLLGTCDLVVQHGGWGTAFTAMAFGLPQVVLPLFPYSAEVAGRVAAAGIGRDVDPAVGPAAMWDAMSAVLTESRYRTAAGAVRRELDEMPSPAEVTDTLRSMT